MQDHTGLQVYKDIHMEMTPAGTELVNADVPEIIKGALCSGSLNASRECL